MIYNISRSKENAIQFPVIDVKSTFIGKNGFAYLNSNQEYFRIEKPDGGAMTIAIRGDWSAYVDDNAMNINTPSLPNNPQLLNSGDWYQDSNGFIKRKS